MLTYTKIIWGWQYLFSLYLQHLSRNELIWSFYRISLNKDTPWLLISKICKVHQPMVCDLFIHYFLPPTSFPLLRHVLMLKLALRLSLYSSCPELVPRQQEHTRTTGFFCRKLYCFIRRKTPNPGKWCCLYTPWSGVSAPDLLLAHHLIAICPRMGSDLARIHSCTCSHYLFTS